MDYTGPSRERLGCVLRAHMDCGGIDCRFTSLGSILHLCLRIVARAHLRLWLLDPEPGHIKSRQKQ